ncbi:MAG TPA: glycosyltransferase family 2 protein [Candidatus Brocadiaceae bacterium]
MHDYTILAAIPVFNEVDAGNIIQRVKKFPLDVLVIDDGSASNLHEKLMHIPHVHVITHPGNLGYGKTIIDAFLFSREYGYDYLLTIDSDGQHEPEEIPLFLKEIPVNDYDIISGSRYFLTGTVNKTVPHERYRINQEITGIINRITGFGLTDSFCGFKTYKVEKLKLMHLTEYGYGMPMQFWIQAWKLGLRVKEIPVKLLYKNPAKQFQGVLKDPDVRLNYYKDIIERELIAPSPLARMN